MANGLYSSSLSHEKNSFWTDSI